MDLRAQLMSANEAASEIRLLTAEKKSELIHAIADSIDEHSHTILEQNKHEVISARKSGLDESQCDRLQLSTDRLCSMIEAAHVVADLEDPVGEILDSWTRDSGITIKKVRVPIGVVAVIYENRPNVTLDSAVISLKSSNVCVLRGSSTARLTNKTIVDAIHFALKKNKLPQNFVTFIDDTTREGATALMRSRGLIDVLIPRGGASLIQAIEENATVPTIIDGAGNCHVYVDKDADLDMAEQIVINSKIQRCSVCNAAESLVVHREVAKEFISRIAEALYKKDVVVVGDSCSVDFGGGHIIQGAESDFASEFLGLKISVAVVESLQGAINHVNKYATGHTECIVTDNPASANTFMSSVTSAVVMHNTSTRFTDGERFGFGAEIGISTQKLHARGPMALRELTTYQYHVLSDGATVV